MTQITLFGPALEGFDPGLPAASVRLLIPTATTELVIPKWNGNEFLLDDGARPIIRTVTPLRFDADRLELDVQIVRHTAGPLSEWVDTTQPGDAVALSGTGRGYEVDPSARSFLIVGDESAIPAIGMLLAALPDAADVQVIVEIRHLDARVDLPAHPGATVQWVVSRDGQPSGDAMLSAMTQAPMNPELRVWAAGEAAAAQRIRRHLLDHCDLPRSQTVVRGYWKHGRRPGPDLG